MKKAVAIVVGGGPAPGINGVISSVAIEAINRGHKVYGIQKGFERIAEGDESCVRPLAIDDVSRIQNEGGSVLFTSRANPTKSTEMLNTIVSVLTSLDVGYLVTIGGDDTANSARAIAEVAGGAISVGHVPKTIDNDLPLPGTDSTFGFHSAREVGTAIVETLMTDAKTTGRYYIVVAMGRKAGHLALGIGTASGATLTIIPEEFREPKIALGKVVDILAGSILKRLANGRRYGVFVLAEGLAEILDPNSVPELANVERDPHGNIRFAELDYSGLVKDALRAALNELGVKLTVVDKNVGYELRCGAPVAFDKEYTRQLGFGVVDYLLNGGSGAMITRQGNRLVPMAFNELIDPDTGKTRIRMVDTNSVTYQVAREYMIRLTKEDLEDDELLGRMSALCNLSEDQLKERFYPSVCE